MSYRSFFGLSAEPFRADLALEQVLTTPELLGVQQRLDYVLRLFSVIFQYPRYGEENNLICCPIFGVHYSVVCSGRLIWWSTPW
jgi:hypothetical protein